ncbi:MAG: type II toxin-antitoxin system RelE/ParE family toxin [Oscillospiraceae bacterium]|nr:type II toxin-antitoxin system RelE/ParE family toxin [Oscillospiraceae bacterium]
MTDRKQYTLEPTPLFAKQFRKLDKFVQRQVKRYMEELVEDGANPKAKGKNLTANRAGQWRYRVGDYRILANIDEEKLIVLSLEVGHRKSIYY